MCSIHGLTASAFSLSNRSSALIFILHWSSLSFYPHSYLPLIFLSFHHDSLYFWLGSLLTVTLFSLSFPPHSYPPLIFLSFHHNFYLFDCILTITLFSLSFPSHFHPHLIFLSFQPSWNLLHFYPSLNYSL